MKTLNEKQALLAAIATSAAVLAGTFSLAGVMRLAQPYLARSAPMTSAQTTTSLPPMTAEAAEGRHLFLLNCAHCHGDDATGDEGPDLHDVRKSDERIHQLITNGVKGEMPSFARKLNDADIHALTSYLRTLHS